MGTIYTNKMSANCQQRLTLWKNDGIYGTVKSRQLDNRQSAKCSSCHYCLINVWAIHWRTQWIWMYQLCAMKVHRELENCSVTVGGTRCFRVWPLWRMTARHFRILSGQLYSMSLFIYHSFAAMVVSQIVLPQPCSLSQLFSWHCTHSQRTKRMGQHKWSIENRNKLNWLNIKCTFFVV